MRLTALAQTALAVQASTLFLPAGDFLLTEQLRIWLASGFEPIAVSEPGTYMPSVGNL
jgi:hypothetical protein